MLAICIRVGDTDSTSAYSDAFEAAFSDGERPSSSLSGALALLQPTEIRHFACESRDRLESLLKSSSFRTLERATERLLVVIIDADPLPKAGRAVRRIPAELDRAPHWTMTVTLFIIAKSLFNEVRAPRSAGFILGLNDLDERDLQVPFFTLHVLRAASAVLMAEGNELRKPKFFFSHAKRDGVSLARGAKLWLGRLKGFKGFYDTDDLDLLQISPR